jgi:hypothetical protein
VNRRAKDGELLPKGGEHRRSVCQMLAPERRSRKMETLVVFATMALIASYAAIVYRALPQN